MALADEVRSVLSDTMNLPPEFLDYMIQFAVQNPAVTAPASGQVIKASVGTSPVTTTGTTFAAGQDLLGTPFPLQAQGGNTYVVRVHAPAWSNSGTNLQSLRLNLNGADQGIFADLAATTSLVPLNAWGVIAGLTTGSYTVNVRFLVAGGTGTISAGAGGASAFMPYVVVLSRL